MSVETGHGAAVTAAAASPDGSFFVSASKDNTLKVWDPLGGTVLRELVGHLDEVAACTVGPEATVFSAGPFQSDLVVKAWNSSAGLEAWSRLVPRTKLGGLAVSPDAEFVAIWCANGWLEIWQPQSGERIRTVTPERRLRAEGGTACTVSPDGTFVVVASGDWDRIHVLDPATGERMVERDSGRDTRTFCVTPDAAGLVYVDREGRWTVTAIASGSSTRLHETGGVSSGVVSPDGSLLASTGGTASVAIRDLASGERVHDLDEKGAAATACAFTPDGRLLISIGQDGALRGWDVEGGDEVGEVPLQAELTSLVVHPFLPIVACGDAAGGFHVLELDLDLGPLVVTPAERGAGSVICCPACGFVFEHEGNGDAKCLNVECGRALRVNPFTITVRTQPLAAEVEVDENAPAIRDMDSPEGHWAEEVYAKSRPMPAPLPARDAEARARLNPDGPDGGAGPSRPSVDADTAVDARPMDEEGARGRRKAEEGVTAEGRARKAQPVQAVEEVEMRLFRRKKTAKTVGEMIAEELRGGQKHGLFTDSQREELKALAQSLGIDVNAQSEGEQGKRGRSQHLGGS